METTASMLVKWNRKDLIDAIRERNDLYQETRWYPVATFALTNLIIELIARLGGMTGEW